MSKPIYKLFHTRTADNIKFEINRLKESAIQKNHKDHSDEGVNLELMKTLLSGNIIDYKETKPSEIQLDCRSEWHNFLTNKTKLNFNECLLILLGINPSLAEQIDTDLYQTQLNDVSDVKNNLLTLILFQRVENHLLRERFRSNSINTEEFIKWAMDYKYLRKIEH
ncbi:MAG: hypothetical protein HOF63_01715 [Thiotrichales bacterium]|jgi:hypothetical protein|nr:hypothetical protein [Thiotrichales bacterium]MBT4654047.1 hypothetical protein [Thiotrichales bacterium]MBT7149985.1 hypothetical protein [Thiotrichales bacterium]MBT7438413.1 hypothetical protein [Thiotrichales bacterium]